MRRSRPLVRLLRLCLLVGLVAGLVAAGAFALTSVAIAQKGKGGGKTIPSGPGWIAFADEGIISVMNPDGTGRFAVAAPNPDPVFGPVNRKPVWSPPFSDGTLHLLFFDIECEGESCFGVLKVVQVFPKFGVPAAIAGLKGGFISYAWSPVVAPLGGGFDAARLAFQDGSVIRIEDLIYDHVTGTFMVNSLLEPVIIDGRPANSHYAQPSFSPDGKWLALWRIPISGLVRTDQIWLASADGLVQRPLLADDGVFYGWPAWSPDGSQLAFISNRHDRKTNEVYVADLDQDLKVTAITCVTNSPGKFEYDPTWSPDGLQIGYYRATTGTVGKVLPTGEQFTLGFGLFPDWSPVDLPPLP
ncbi:MAG: PD40 domain-containing protein [Planctomycetia bacterium]|nr:PD40 domain-containing protein [Planctomycetia bacterium]